MQVYRQATFSFLFFIGSLLLSVIVVPGVLEVSGTTQKYDGKDVSRISQNLHRTLIRLINKEIIIEHLEASYKYLSMAVYFDRTDVALPGFSKYFRKLSDKEFERANFLMSYLNKRGGYIELRTVEAPTRNHWTEGLDAMYDALNIQKTLNDKLIRLHKEAGKFGDPHMTFALEDNFLDPKVNTIKEIGDHIANLERLSGANYGLGEYMFDKEL